MVISTKNLEARIKNVKYLLSLFLFFLPLQRRVIIKISCETSYWLETVKKGLKNQYLIFNSV